MYKDFSAPLLIIGSRNRQIICRDIEDLKIYYNLISLIYIYRACHKTVAEYTFVSNTQSIYQDRTTL